MCHIARRGLRALEKLFRKKRKIQKRQNRKSSNRKERIRKRFLKFSARKALAKIKQTVKSMESCETDEGLDCVIARLPRCPRA
jgi:hypothetical protein